jgi:WD repeat-containing protein 19
MSSGGGLRPLFILPDRLHGGRGKVSIAWNSQASLLATSGANGMVRVFDRHGIEVADIQLESKAVCISLDWDKDGEALAILQQGVERVAVWESSTSSVLYVDTQLKEPTFMKWSKNGPQLAIGASKGGLVIFRRDSRKKLPIAGKHSKGIVCGDWSSGVENRLALGGLDSLLTISSADGDTIEQTQLKLNPQGVVFASTVPKKLRQAGSTSSQNSTTSSSLLTAVNLSGKSILLYDATESPPPAPTELAFQPKYGKIVAHSLLSDGSVVIGFSEGILMATNKAGDELFCSKIHSKDGLDSLASSAQANRIAVSGGAMVKIIEIGSSTRGQGGWSELKDEFATVDVAHGPIDFLSWTPDGQILTAATRSGHVYSFLARIPSVSCSWGARVAFLSSLKQVTVSERPLVASDNELLDDPSMSSSVITLELPVEPMILGIGGSHLAAAVNDRVLFVPLMPSADGSRNPRGGGGGGGRKNGNIEVDYLGTVDDIRLSDKHAAVLVAGKVLVHALGSETPNVASMRRIPDVGDNIGGGVDLIVTSIAIGGNFLFIGTSIGTLSVFSLSDWSLLPSPCEMRLEESAGAVRALFPNARGTKVIVLDSINRVLLFSPVNGSLILVPDTPSNVERCLWDHGATDPGLFALSTASNSALQAYLFSPTSLTGPVIATLGTAAIRANGNIVTDAVPTQLPSQEAMPLFIADGVAHVHLPASSSISPVTLISHLPIARAQTGRVSVDKVKDAFAASLALSRLHHAWTLAAELDDKACWLALSAKAMESLELELAQMVYRRLGDAGMVQSLSLVKQIECKLACAGHVALLFGDHGLAQDLLLRSSDAQAALDMRKDLLEWDVALKLAETIDPQQVPALSFERARQLEFKGEYAEALSMFERAESLFSTSNENATDELKTSISAGVARCSMRLGDVRRGAAVASTLKNNQFVRECAAILESMRNFDDAALLYKKAENYDKAVSLLIAAKNFTAAAPLMELTSAPKLHLAFAKSREAAKDYVEAVRSYEKGRDTDSVVRLLLEHLKKPERAAEVVRTSRSTEGAQAMARFCKSAGDFRGAIEFLLLAKKRDDAFELAAANNEMGLYVQALRAALAPSSDSPSNGTSEANNGNNENTKAQVVSVLPTEECTRVAAWFEGKQNLIQAAELYTECSQYQKALSLYLRSGEGDAILPRTIELAGKAKSDAVTHALIDYLMGETDGQPKDPKWVFKLYLALGDYQQATKTASIIADQEQASGNYKVAHGVLFETHRALEQSGTRTPRVLQQALLLLHSYLLVKRLVKLEQHEAAARMCLRVARSISRFPMHVVPILTSAVIECQRAGLKKSAFEYACVLMRPEHKDNVEEKFKKKIEALVRRPSDEELEERMCSCPFCGSGVATTDLSCQACKSGLPMCILTGTVVLANDASACPSCKFPASLAALLQLSQSPEPNCPMCNVAISPSQVVPQMDPIAFLRRVVDGPSEEKE